MIANYEKSKEEQEATVRMFCTYCWKSLLNARKDIARRPGSASACSATCVRAS